MILYKEEVFGANWVLWNHIDDVKILLFIRKVLTLLLKSIPIAMHKTLHPLICCLQFAVFVVAAAFGTSASASFQPYKGVCWGLFYYADDMDNLFDFVPVSYVRAAEDCYILPDFVGCGENLYVYVGDAGSEGYCSVHLEMEGAGYDNSNSAYFYLPFSAGGYDWHLQTSSGTIIGPISQTNSYYHEPLEYLGLYYYTRAGGYFAYFDIKFDQDYDEVARPREYIDDPEELEFYDQLLDVHRLQALRRDLPAYQLSGQRAAGQTHGIVIEQGRKVLK